MSPWLESLSGKSNSLFFCFSSCQLTTQTQLKLNILIKVSSLLIIYIIQVNVQLKITKASLYEDMRDYILLYDTL